MDDIEELHRRALDAGEATYTDPSTGYTVMTRETLRRRGRCCGNGCRHCPYGHVNVKDPARRRNLVQSMVLIPFSGRKLQGLKADILFFSGGKDSYLATLRLLKELQEQEDRVVILLTTFAQNGMVGHQQVPFREVICEQARNLRLDLLALPLESQRNYEAQVLSALEMLRDSHGLELCRLVFGDLHVQAIRDWREKMLRFPAPLDTLTFHYPVWHASYETLMQELEASGARVHVCALGDSCSEQAKQVVEIGARYDAAFVKSLRSSDSAMDAFGENGEFHSVVCINDMDPDAILKLIVSAQEEELQTQELRVDGKRQKLA